jgi:hypothetical protein
MNARRKRRRAEHREARRAFDADFPMEGTNIPQLRVFLSFHQERLARLIDGPAAWEKAGQGT